MSANILLLLSVAGMAAALVITRFVPPTPPPSDPNWGETLRYIFTSTISAPITNSSPTVFGLLYMMDDPLTETADPNSKLLGRAQGLFGASSAHNEISLIMGISIVFTADDKFKGSTITVFTRNPYQHGSTDESFR
ncbi:hypothetical protein MKW94_003914 [Papaver nudicaule]|uniref:Dirigent protein n=1 Tax=Papaver nudicaule TaxID=74823 RepID=A0AA41SCH9_PAPNU|nr:hypothetical protein [Papaver nudicaule]